MGAQWAQTFDAMCISDSSESLLDCEGMSLRIEKAKDNQKISCSNTFHSDTDHHSTNNSHFNYVPEISHPQSQFQSHSKVTDSCLEYDHTKISYGSSLELKRPAKFSSICDQYHL